MRRSPTGNQGSPIGATRVFGGTCTGRQRSGKGLDRARCGSGADHGRLDRRDRRRSDVRQIGRHGRLPLRDQACTLASAGCGEYKRATAGPDTPYDGHTRRHGLAALCRAGDWVNRRCHAARRVAAFQARWKQGLRRPLPFHHPRSPSRVPHLGKFRNERAAHARVAAATRRAKHFPPFRSEAECPALRAKIFIFPKDRTYDLAKTARLDTGDVMAIRHQT